MVDRYLSKPLELPAAGLDFSRADLVLYGLDHSGPTYEGRIFIGAKRGLKQGAGSDDLAYAGSFFVFGNGSCHGDVGHCDVPEERDELDFRFAHHLTPGVEIVTVTESIRRLADDGRKAARVTILAYDSDGAAAAALDFTNLRLLTYA